MEQESGIAPKMGRRKSLVKGIDLEIPQDVNNVSQSEFESPPYIVTYTVIII